MHPELPSRIGPFEVLEPIAQGGMARLLRVRDQITGEHRALKLLMHTDGRQLFDVEFEAMNQLNHPSIVRTHLYGNHDGNPWFTMELLRGNTGSIHARSLGDPGDPRRTEGVSRMTALLARALHHVHQHGILHRDVKTGNVLVLPDGRLKLVDFGVAHVGRVGDHVPPGARLVGTPAYMAPELVRRAPYDHRADLYALGVFLYRLVCGSAPFKAKRPEDVFKMHLQAQVPDPTERVSNLSKPLVRLMKALLSKQAGDRPRHAGVVADELDSLLGQTILPGTAIAVHEPLRAEGVLDAHQTAIAVGRMLGRRPPSGVLAQRMHDVTAGQPSAIEELVMNLVERQLVDAEGDQVLWARQALELKVPDILATRLRAEVEDCTALERMVLNAVGLVPGISLQALTQRIPSSGDSLSLAVSGLEERGLLRTEGGLHLATEALALVIRQGVEGSRRSSLERLLSSDPYVLPITPVRIRALLRTGDAAQAVQDARVGAHALMAAGRVDEACRLLHEVCSENSEALAEGPVAEVMLLYAECSALLKPDAQQQAALAVATAQRLAQSPGARARCALTEARLQLGVGHYGNYDQRVARARAAAVDVTDPVVTGRLAFAEGQSALWAGRVRVAERALADVDLDLVAPQLATRVMALMARCAYERGQLREALKLADGAILECGVGGLGHAEALRVRADALRRQGRFSEAIGDLHRASARYRAQADSRPFLEVMLAIGWCEADLHRLGPAQDCVDELVASIRSREHLHLRLQRDLLGAHLTLLSGRAIQASYAAQRVADLAKTAGLTMLSEHARAIQMKSECTLGIPVKDLKHRYESGRLGFLERRLVWPHVETCRVMVSHHPSRPDPDAIFGSILETLGDEPCRMLHIELLLTRARHAVRDGSKQVALFAARDAARMVAEVNADLADSERGAFKVHPWSRAIREAVAAVAGPRRQQVARS